MAYKASESANVRYVRKSIERLLGIIEGIAIDCEMESGEITALNNWLESHECLICMEPFKSVYAEIQKILEDQIIDEQEKEDFLDWCSDFINYNPFLKNATQAVRRLHGVLSGIDIDNLIKQDEIEGLKDWLRDYERFSDIWPFSELGSLISKILEDGIIDDAEAELLRTFFNDFNEVVVNTPQIHDDEYELPWLMNDSPVFNPISSICDKVEVVFKHKVFCFTGPAITGKRKDLHNIVSELGGSCSDSVSGGLDYLVIGGQSSPAWVYSTYGRKIEKAIKQRENTGEIRIVDESTFIDAVKKNDGFKFLPKND
jgi:NAD-dependent DNA ligase